MELSSEEKLAIERDRVVRVVREAGETLSFDDLSKAYVEKFKSDLVQWKKEFTNFGAFLKYSAGADLVVVHRRFQSLVRVNCRFSICQNPNFHRSLDFPRANTRTKEWTFVSGDTKLKAPFPLAYIPKL